MSPRVFVVGGELRVVEEVKPDSEQSGRQKKQRSDYQRDSPDPASGEPIRLIPGCAAWAFNRLLIHSAKVRGAERDINPFRSFALGKAQGR